MCIIFKFLSYFLYILFSVVVLMFVSTEGVTIGAHRLFAHKTFKASPVLKAILIFAQTMAGQVTCNL